MQQGLLANSHPKCGSIPQQGQLLEGKEGKGKGSPGTCPISPGGATALVFTQEHTWESVECGRRIPERGVILFWSNLLCGSEQTPSPLWCSDSQLSNAGLGLSASPAPMLHIVALLPWAGAWLRHGKQCTGHWSRILCLPKALFLGPLQVICRQQPRAKQVKTSARPPSTVQPTLQTPTMLQSLSTGPTMAPPKVVCPAG